MSKYEEPGDELGGESSCYAHLLCQECGAVLDGHHDANHGARRATTGTNDATT